MKRLVYVRSSNYIDPETLEDIIDYSRYQEQFLDLLKYADSKGVNIEDTIQLANYFNRYDTEFMKYFLDLKTDMSLFNESQLKVLKSLYNNGRDIQGLLDPSIPASKMKKYYPSVNSVEFKEALEVLKTNIHELLRLGILQYDKLAVSSKFVYLWYLKDAFSADEINQQIDVIKKLPQCHNVVLGDGTVSNDPAYKIAVVPEITEDTSLGSASNNSRFTKSRKMYTIKYTEFTGTWESHDGIEVLHIRKPFESDLDCLQYVVYNLVGDYDQYDAFSYVDMDNVDSIKEFLDIVNDTDPESVLHVILSIKRDRTTIYKTR